MFFDERERMENMTGQFKKLRLVTAMVLAALMAALIPVQAGAIVPPAPSAAENQAFGTQGDNETSAEEEETKPAEILAEVEEDRDQYTKHFRMDDGSFMAVQYEYPVHFQNKDGEWVDYDNTMKEVPVENVTEAGTDSVETTAAQTEAVTASGTTPAETNDSAVPQNKAASQDETEAASIGETEAETDAAEPASLDAEENVEYENKKSDLDIRLAKKAKKGNMVKIKGDGYQVSWGFPGVSKSQVELIENNEQLTGNDRFLARKNLVQEALYKDAFPNVDLQYFVTPAGIKENMILKNKDAQTEFEIAYKINGLTAEKKNDFTIVLKNKDGEAVYEIYAPFMTDSKGEKSTQLQMVIKEQKNHKLTVVLSADEAWLDDAKREYPVTLDPVFEKGEEWQTVDCAYVDSSKPTESFGYGSATGYTGTVNVGTFGSGKYRTFIRMKNLPQLNKGDIVVASYLNMHLHRGGFHQPMVINAHQVTSSWTQSTVNWNWAVGSDRYESKISDYDSITPENESNVWRKWNITSNVKRWYDGESNYGIMLKAQNENEQCAEFYSSNYPDSTIPRPVFTIIYRNNKGLEDYWTYTSFNAGTAGTAYVNDYTGNLVFVHNDASTGGDLMPLSISHVFNNYMANVTYTQAPPLTGKGWKLSIQQTVQPSSQFGLTGDAAKNYPYVYTDSDGTEHYFYKKTTDGKTEYVDEDGLKLKLTVNTSSTVARYVITDEKDNKMEFHKNGLLRKIISANGKFIYVKYDTDDKTILYVHDGAGQKITFVPNSSGSGSLSRMTDPAGRQCIFYYTTEAGHSGYMSQIKNADGTSVYFTYDNDGSLTSVTDIDGYKVSFSYSSAATGKQVTAVQEYGTDGKAGQKVTFDRTRKNSTVVQTSGVDGIYGNTDDLKTTKQFDDYGRTMSIKSQTGNHDLGAAGCQYTSGEPNADGSNLSMINRVTNEYNLGSHAVNLLKNHNMEATGSWTSAVWGGAPITFTAANTAEQKYMGKQSMKINTTAVTGTSSGRVYQDVVLKPDTSYTLSAYVKTTGFNTTAANTGALIGATSFNSSNVATDFYSERIQSATDTSINGGWRRLTLTFKVPADSVKVRLNLALRGTTGTAYFDAVQLEEYNIVNTYNMLENPSLESYTGALPTSWTGSGLTSPDVKTADARTGSYAFKITGDPSKEKLLYQSVNVTGSEEDTYIVSGWAKGNAALEEDGNNKKFKLSVKVVYSDGTSIWKRAADFNSAVSDWQFTSSAFTLSDGTSAKKTPAKIEVYINYSNQINTAIFDNIQLIKDVAQSYTYDKDGHVITVQKDAEQKGTMEYTNADLTKSIDSKGYAYTYEYDKKHNMTKATSQRGMITEYTYDNDTGVPTQLEVHTPSKSASLLATVSYTANKAYVSKAADQDGNTATYTYDQNRGTLQSASDSSGTVNYTYDANNDLLKSVSKDINGGLTTVMNQYVYDATGKNLIRIGHNGTNYGISYDAFGNKTKTMVGSQTLATYTYGANNGLLQKQTYGTGQSVGFTYDAFGNIATQSYNGTTAFKWFSDRTGAVTRHQDLINGIQYDSDYDVTGRLVRQSAVSTENSGNRLYALEYGYDLNNNVSKLVNIANGKTAKNEYVYGKDNLPEKYTIDGSRNVTYVYDTLNRLKSTSIATTKPIDMGYVYWLSKRNTDGGDQYRTTKIKEETIGSEKLAYEYDDRGNITSIKKMTYHADGTEVGYTTPVAAYEYDELGQLVYDMDYTARQLREYTYDAGGNLLKEHLTIYSSSGAVVTTQDTNYAYTDTNWKDKLTSYGGKAITYDEIGNPLSYRGMTMTWQNGRQLATLQKGSTAVSYTYDAGSVRATKTVNGEKYTYQYLNGKLIHETRGEKSFHYYYDANGYFTAIKYRLTPDGQDYAYYASHNWRGDVVGLYNGNGELVAKYDYDTWGKVKSVKDANNTNITDQNHVGNLNPFRYRGYYYDKETQLYYLMSRYYDPVTHRFLNADGYFQSGNAILDANMNAYCGNNPVNSFDPSGKWTSDFMQRDIAFNKNTIFTMNDVLEQLKRETPGFKVTASVDHKNMYPGLFVNNYSGVTTQTKVLSSKGGDDVIYYGDIINGSPRFGVSQPSQYFNTDANISAHDININLGWGENYVGAGINWDTYTLNFESGTTFTSNGLDTTSYSGFSINIGTVVGAAFLIMSGLGALVPFFA